MRYNSWLHSLECTCGKEGGGGGGGGGDTSSMKADLMTRFTSNRTCLYGSNGNTSNGIVVIRFDISSLYKHFLEVI